MSNQLNEISLVNLYKRLKLKSKYILSKWVIISICTFVFGFVGFFYKSYIGVEYKSTLTFVSENASGDKMGAYAGIAAQFGIDLGQSGGGVFEGDNLLELFKSKKLIVNTLLSSSNDKGENKLLINQYIDNHNLTKVLANLSFENYDVKTQDRIKDSVINKIFSIILKSQLTIEKKDKKIGFIYLEIKDKNEIFAKIFAEKLSENVIKYYTEYKTKRANDNLTLLKNQADSLRQLLNASISDEASSVDLNINPIKQVLRTSVTKKRIDVSANTAMYSEVLKQLAIAKITLLRETPLIQIIDKPTMPLEKIGIGKGLTSILFAFIGFFLIVIYLIIMLWVKSLLIETI